MAGRKCRYVQFDLDVSVNAVVPGSVTCDQGDEDRSTLPPSVWRIVRDVTGRVFVRAATPKIPTGSTFAGGLWEGDHVSDRWCSPSFQLGEADWRRLEQHIASQVAAAASLGPDGRGAPPNESRRGTEQRSASPRTADPLTESDPMKALDALEARLAAGQDPWASSVIRQPSTPPTVRVPKKRSFWDWFTGAGLVPCPDCGRDVSRTAKTCPGCGRPL